MSGGSWQQVWRSLGQNVFILKFVICHYFIRGESFHILSCDEKMSGLVKWGNLSEFTEHGEHWDTSCNSSYISHLHLLPQCSVVPPTRLNSMINDCIKYYDKIIMTIISLQIVQIDACVDVVLSWSILYLASKDAFVTATISQEQIFSFSLHSSQNLMSILKRLVGVL